MKNVLVVTNDLLLSSARGLVDDGYLTITQYATMLRRSRDIDSEIVYSPDEFVNEARSNANKVKKRLIKRGVLYG